MRFSSRDSDYSVFWGRVAYGAKDDGSELQVNRTRGARNCRENACNQELKASIAMFEIQETLQVLEQDGGKGLVAGTAERDGLVMTA